MESILDSLAAEKLYPSGGTNLLDLEELSDGDFLTNVVSFKPVQLVRTVCLGFFACLSLFICLFASCHLRAARKLAARAAPSAARGAFVAPPAACSARSRTSGGAVSDTSS